jgi:hypothetical protein
MCIPGGIVSLCGSVSISMIAVFELELLARATTTSEITTEETGEKTRMIL